MASKFDQFLKASWNAIFWTKRRQETKYWEKLASARRNAQPPGEGLGEKSWRFDVKNLASGRIQKDKKTWIQRFSTPSPVGRRIEAPLGGVPPPKVFGVGRVAIRKGVWKKKAWRFEFS